VVFWCLFLLVFWLFLWFLVGAGAFCGFGFCFCLWGVFCIFFGWCGFFCCGGWVVGLVGFGGVCLVVLGMGVVLGVFLRLVGGDFVAWDCFDRALVPS
ncbi:hypothetical protein, partial [Pseudomonas syringae group genomosp. 7]|uniref:hypothetical protein n=1 Tax=Pseudomonas syringae group genomosp. 7 TaxID=251699 RepID=UPI00376F5968